MAQTKTLLDLEHELDHENTATAIALAPEPGLITSKKAKPKALVLTGYGINCFNETAYAFNLAGADAEIVHINDLIEGDKKLADYQILAFPGGFSFADDTGSGNAFAFRIRNNLWDKVQEFISRDGLAIGICNGMQIMVNLGFLPAFDGAYGTKEVALMHNDSARYTDRWVDLRFYGKSPWTRSIKEISVPIAHGEGKLYAEPHVIEKMKKKQMIACTYFEGEVCRYQNLKANPNGSLEDIAGITDESGRFFAMMPHPERAMFFTQLLNWPLMKEKLKRERRNIPSEGTGMKIFRNGVDYFK